MRTTLGGCVTCLLALTLLGCSDWQFWKAESKVDGLDPTTVQIRKLVIDLKASDPEVRREAAAELRDIETADRKDTRQALGKALRDPVAQVRQEAAETLRSFGSPDALKELRSASRDGYQEAREAYAQATQDLREQARKGEGSSIQTLSALGEKRIHD